MIDISKFDDLEDLPVSEEILGAYLEGNMDGSELREIQNFIHADGCVSNLMETLQDDFSSLNEIDNTLINSNNQVMCAENDFADIAFPEIESLSATTITMKTPYLEVTND